MSRNNSILNYFSPAQKRPPENGQSPGRGNKVSGSTGKSEITPEVTPAKRQRVLESRDSCTDDFEATTPVASQIKKENRTSVKKEPLYSTPVTRGSVAKSDSTPVFLSLDTDDEEEDSIGSDFSPETTKTFSQTPVQNSLKLSKFKSTPEPVKNGNQDDKTATPKTSRSFTPRSSSKSVSSSRQTPNANKSLKDKLGHLKNENKVDNETTDDSEWPPTDPFYSFLWPDKIKDREGRKRDDPNYDASTLYIPPSFLAKQSEAQRQWWELKSKHFDTVLAFKVGKFYELFRMDSLIGVEELNLLPMGGSKLHCGFPEKSFAKYAESLREKGFRVARVEQTESTGARDERLKSSNGNKAKVVRREICQITTPGTARGINMDSGDGSGRYLLSLCQKTVNETGDGVLVFGVSFIDTSIGRFYVGQFHDDRHCSRLRTLIALYPPIEVLVEKNNLSSEAQLVVKNCLSSFVDIRYLFPGRQYPCSQKTLQAIRERMYFTCEENGDDYPPALLAMLDPNDNLKQTALPDYDLGIKAFGAVLFYLKDCLIDEELVTLKMFEEYVPPEKEVVSKDHTLPASVVLDACTLNNLDVFNSDFGVKKSLFGLVNHTKTKFGERMLRFWICSPLTDVDKINARLDATEDLEEVMSKEPNIFAFLRKLPDLEQLLNRIHTQGLKRKNDHPDSRAQMFEDYDRKKIINLLRVMDGLHEVVKFIKDIEKFVPGFKSCLLKNILTPISSGGSFPDIEKMLTKFALGFDVQEARKSFKIIPRDDGSWKEFSDVCQEIREFEGKFKAILRRESGFFGGPIKFGHSGKKRYLLEIPVDVFNRCSEVNKPKYKDIYRFEGSTKSIRRYSTVELEKLLEQLKKLEEMKQSLLSDHKRRLFELFSKDLHQWMQGIKVIAVLDCLLSLTMTKASFQAVTQVTRPVFLPDQLDDPIIEIKEGKHPLLTMITSTNFVSNDVTLTGDKLIILTGPNMGGKSTLMRQTGLIVLLSQMGCHVPASSVKLTPVDRIFTRIGASDRIIQGESTFYVEMSETASILRHASRHSLVLLDELGRGTSTFDGTAIAFAVIKGLASETKARTFFSTHYHSLVESFEGNPNVTAAHMDCSVQGNDIVFLYRLKDGDCPKSQGFYSARMAGIPEDIITEGQEVSKKMEDKALLNKYLSRVFGKNASSSLIQDKRQLIKMMQQLVVA